MSVFYILQLKQKHSTHYTASGADIHDVHGSGGTLSMEGGLPARLCNQTEQLSAVYALELKQKHSTQLLERIYCVHGPGGTPSMKGFPLQIMQSA